MISKFSLTLSIISCNVSSKWESVHIVWQYLIWCVIDNLHFKWDATLTSHFMYFLVRNYEEFTRNVRHSKMSILSLRQQCGPLHCETCKNWAHSYVVSQSRWSFMAVRIDMGLWRLSGNWQKIGVLTHWGRVMDICVSKLTIFASDNGLSPDRHLAIIWINAGILLIGPLGTNFSEILIKMYIFSFKKMHLKMSSGNGSHFVSASMC